MLLASAMNPNGRAVCERVIEKPVLETLRLTVVSTAVRDVGRSAITRLSVQRIVFASPPGTARWGLAYRVVWEGGLKALP